MHPDLEMCSQLGIPMLNDAVYDAFSLIDHVLRRPVTVFHMSEQPACRRLTWEILTEHTL